LRSTLALIAVVAAASVMRASTQVPVTTATSAQQYEFGKTDIDIIVGKIGQSLLTFERAGFDHSNVAWLRLRNDTEERKLPLNLLMESVETVLVKAARCQVLKRTELEKIAEENALTMTALVDPSNTARLGSLAKVHYWLSGTLSSKTNREAGKEYVYYNFTVFLTDALTSERVWGESAELKKERKLQLVEKRIK
jgi:hypothetical protein